MHIFNSLLLSSILFYVLRNNCVVILLVYITDSGDAGTVSVDDADTVIIAESTVTAVTDVLSLSDVAHFHFEKDAPF